MRMRFIWRALKTRYLDQRPELGAIRAAISTDGIAIDVGAYKGGFLYWLSRWNRLGRAIAFEPQDELAEYLIAAAATLRLGNVTVEAKGVADKPGHMDFFSPGGTVSPGASFSHRVADRGNCTKVMKEVVTLDDYLDVGARVSVIKIDAEGLELQIFRGAERVLYESAPLLVFESENRHLEHGVVDDVLNHLYERGYDGHFVHRGSLIPARHFDTAMHQREIGDRFYAQRDYCNSFIFRKI